MKKLKLTPGSILKYFLSIIAILMFLQFSSIISEFVFGRRIGSFDFDIEKNIPSLYSALAIFLCGVLLWLISSTDTKKHKGYSLRWRVISLIFVLLALDEFYSIHERFETIGQQIMGDSAHGYLHFSWFIPFLAVFVFIGLFFIKFFLRLPFKTKKLFILAGIVFLSGAVGMEMLGGNYISHNGEEGFDHLPYRLITTGEELFEMLGIAIFIYALSGHYMRSLNTNEIKIICVNPRTITTQ